MSRDWTKLTADLERLLKLRSIPFGMKLFERREEMEAIPRIRRPTSIHTLDQIVAQAARLGWTVGLLPIPRDWHRVRARLACLAERGESVTSGELWDAALDAYGLNAAAVAPLAAWILGPTR